MFRGFGFVQFEHIEEAEAAKVAQKGRIYKSYKIGKPQLDGVIVMLNGKSF